LKLINNILSLLFIFLIDNNAVEDALGEKNIICLQDLSHEIYTVGENFEAAKNILCTFKLSAPVGSYEKNALKIHDNVEEKGGFIGENIELFLNKIL
jgi:large subunit ribosomal protein L7e